MEKIFKNYEANICPDTTFIVNGCEVEEISVLVDITSREVDNGCDDSEWGIESTWEYPKNAKKFEVTLEDGTKAYPNISDYADILGDLINEWIQDFDPEFYDNDVYND